MTHTYCPYCSTLLPVKEIIEGWCETCGKRIPLYVLKEARIRPGAIDHCSHQPELPKGKEQPGKSGEDHFSTEQPVDGSADTRQQDREVIRLMEALTSPKPHIRWEATAQLGRMGSRAAPALDELRRISLEDRDALVRRVAQEALATIDFENAGPDESGCVPPDQTDTSAPHPVASLHNYLVPAILSTLFCCMPFGIVAIICAAQANGKLAAGDYRGAEDAASQAKIWCLLSYTLGLVAITLYTLVHFIPR